MSLQWLAVIGRLSLTSESGAIFFCSILWPWFSNDPGPFMHFFSVNDFHSLMQMGTIPHRKKRLSTIKDLHLLHLEFISYHNGDPYN